MSGPKIHIQRDIRGYLVSRPIRNPKGENKIKTKKKRKKKKKKRRRKRQTIRRNLFSKDTKIGNFSWGFSLMRSRREEDRRRPLFVSNSPNIERVDYCGSMECIERVDYCGSMECIGPNCNYYLPF